MFLHSLLKFYHQNDQHSFAWQPFQHSFATLLSPLRQLVNMMSPATEHSRAFGLPMPSEGIAGSPRALGLPVPSAATVGSQRAYGQPAPSEGHKNSIRRLKARLSAAKLVLESATGGARENLSKIQSRAVLSLIDEAHGTGRFDAETCAELTVVATSVPWSGPALASIVEALGREEPHPSADARGQARRANQLVMPALLSYFTHSDWIVLGSASMAAMTRMETVFRRMMQLNIRNPTERCIQEMAAWAMQMEFGDERMWQLVSTQRAAMHDTVRNRFRQVRKCCPEDPGSAYPTGLPVQPEDFEKAYPELFSKTFRCERPVPSRLHITHIQEFASTWNVRGGVSKAAMQSCMMSPRWQAPAGSMGGLRTGAQPAHRPQLQLEYTKCGAQPAIQAPSAKPASPIAALQALTMGRPPSPASPCVGAPPTTPGSECPTTPHPQEDSQTQLALEDGAESEVATSPRLSGALATFGLPVVHASARLAGALEDFGVPVVATGARLTRAGSQATLGEDGQDEECGDLARGVLSDFLNMERGVRNAKKTPKQPLPPIQAPQPAPIAAAAAVANTDDASVQPARKMRRLRSKATVGPMLAMPATVVPMLALPAPAHVEAAPEQAAPPAPSTASEGRAFICHEKTRRCWRVRIGSESGRGGVSKGFSYKAGDAADMARAKSEAEAFATSRKW